MAKFNDPIYPSAAPLDGTEIMHGYQGGVSKQMTPAQIKTYTLDGTAPLTGIITKTVIPAGGGDFTTLEDAAEWFNKTSFRNCRLALEIEQGSYSLSADLIFENSKEVELTIKNYITGVVDITTDYNIYFTGLRKLQLTTGITLTFTDGNPYIYSIEYISLAQATFNLYEYGFIVQGCDFFLASSCTFVMEYDGDYGMIEPQTPCYIVCSYCNFESVESEYNFALDGLRDGYFIFTVCTFTNIAAVVYGNSLVRGHILGSTYSPSPLSYGVVYWSDINHQYIEGGLITDDSGDPITFASEYQMALTGTITKTVGTGQDFENIDEAFTWINTTQFKAADLTLALDAGAHVMTAISEDYILDCTGIHILTILAHASGSSIEIPGLDGTSADFILRGCDKFYSYIPYSWPINPLEFICNHPTGWDIFFIIENVQYVDLAYVTFTSSTTTYGGLRLEYVDSARFQNCTFVCQWGDNTELLECRAVSDLYVSSCNFNCTGDGVGYANGIKMNNAGTHITISSSTFLACDNGVITYKTTHGSIMGCTFTDLDGSPYYGFTLNTVMPNGTLIYDNSGDPITFAPEYQMGNLTGVTVANLPAIPITGMTAQVTDADTPVIGSTVVGGAAAIAQVWYNGSNWTVTGV